MHGGNPLRREIEEMIETGDLKGLLYKAGEIHGHLCSYLAYGVMAGYLAMRELGVRSRGMEEVVAIVETNNCFSDGIQVVTGCTFGNNALIYRDLGKTAVTVAKRNGTAIRVALDPDFESSRAEAYPEASELWDKIVARREEATPEEQRRMMELFAEMSLKELERPFEEVFKVRRLRIKVPEYAPIFSSVRCAVCGENIMETKARVKDGRPVCMACAGGEHYVLDGAGISVKDADEYAREVS
ncbi:formylmethanofuran dehydrogenase [Candidatus Bathyarchaeota archaeon]|nr:MAG: formylmethanofuran dehydrogenase [Candidatus Bathyarchaeota archaeon]